MTRALAMISGRLDSILAARIAARYSKGKK